jgi:hypothetical protein
VLPLLFEELRAQLEERRVLAEEPPDATGRAGVRLIP